MNAYMLKVKFNMSSGRTEPSVSVTQNTSLENLSSSSAPSFIPLVQSELLTAVPFVPHSYLQARSRSRKHRAS